MKKTILLIFTLVVIYTIGLISFFEYKEKDKELIIGKDKINGMISVMIEKDGKYERSTSSSWPNGDYELNKSLSKCENGSSLKYDKKTKKVIMSTSKTDKCYLYFDITGTESNPYKIETIEDLVNLSNDVNDGNTFAGKYFVLTRDLDFLDSNSYENSERTDYEDYNNDSKKESLLTELTNGSGFKPIGLTGSFQGIFDGRYKGISHRIDNLYIKRITDTNDKYAFFGYVANGIIKNLTISGDIKTEVASPLGGIVNNLENSIIENCINEINIINNFGTYAVGGVVGWIYGQDSNEIKIINCVNKGNISGGGQTGGILGNHQVGKLIIENSINEGTIRNNYGDTIGGLIGLAHDQLKQEIKPTLVIKNSVNRGKIISNTNNEKNISLGGLIGNLNNIGSVMIENSYNTGDITNERTEYSKFYALNLGGLVGYIDNTETKINNSYNTGYITNGTYAGGIISNIYHSNVVINKTYNLGDIKTNIGTLLNVNSGIVGWNHGISTTNTDISKLIVLNSYNVGNVTSIDGTTTGLVGVTDFYASNYILNSYNIGKIKGQYSYGTTVINEYGYYLYLINVYNLGDINGKDTSFGSSFIDTSTINSYKIYNTYYANEKTEKGTNLSNDSEITTGMNEADMKNAIFVETLNSNIKGTQIKEETNFKDLTTIDPLLAGYSLSNWELGLDGYPVLVNE